MSIEQDQSRYHKKVKDIVAGRLKGYLHNENLIGRQGKDLVSIPIPNIEIPHFRFAHPEETGMGEGEGDQQGEGRSIDPKDRLMEVEMEFDEFVSILGEDLQLPPPRTKQGDVLTGTALRYKGIQTAPSPKIDRLRSFKKSLARTFGINEEDRVRQAVINMRLPGHARYRSPKEVIQRDSRMVMVVMMDVSGSMTSDKRDKVRKLLFWTTEWLRTFYKRSEILAIAHDELAYAVDLPTLFGTSSGGSTRVASSFELAAKLIGREMEDSRFAPSENLYQLYDPNTTDVYMLYGGDFEDQEPDRTLQTIEHLLPFVRSIAMAYTPTSGMMMFNNQRLHQLVRDNAQKFNSNPENARLTHAVVGDDEGNIYNSLRMLYPKRK